jgi:UDP-2,3-diacylglucosamine pyrophosphatase LpxH
MLVLLSDVHLTDGSSGETIKPSAFKLFAEQQIKLAESVNDLNEIKVVLLGDIFDVIRSTRWLDNGNTIRPWDPKSDQQKEIVETILRAILDKNRELLGSFLPLSEYAVERKIPFEITYVVGNHDWLINRYQSCRKMVSACLNIAETGDDALFPTELLDNKYRVLARHGDIYDKFNYMGTRDASSIGDAIVIELLNRYPREVGQRLAKLVALGTVTADEHKKITERLKELDNIRPLLDAPSWVLMVSGRTSNPVAREVIEKAWAECVDDFFKVEFIKDQDKFLWPDTIDLLQVALQLSSHTTKKFLEKIADFKERFFSGKMEGDYHKAAFAEPKVRSGEVSYVVYGHTHDHLMVPMDQVPTAEGKSVDKVYFNTGTWRKTWNKAWFDHVNREFIGWHVLSYVTIFAEEENGDYNFEVWNGALG